MPIPMTLAETGSTQHDVRLLAWLPQLRGCGHGLQPGILPSGDWGPYRVQSDLVFGNQLVLDLQETMADEEDALVNSMNTELLQAQMMQTKRSACEKRTGRQLYWIWVCFS